MKRVAVLVMLLLFVLATANTSEARGGRGLFRNLRNSRMSQSPAPAKEPEQIEEVEEPVEEIVEEPLDEIVEPEEILIPQIQTAPDPQERPSFSLLAIPFGSEAQRTQIAEVPKEDQRRTQPFSLAQIDLNPAQTISVRSTPFRAPPPAPVSINFGNSVGYHSTPSAMIP
jgi:hypothetical protein